VHDLGKEIHNLLPFSDDFRGHFDRMCHARSCDLAAQKRSFSVDTLVHAEQFLGFDGKGSITAPSRSLRFSIRSSRGAGNQCRWHFEAA
jgi:hypothetical protein